jgi:hypothetical protein
MLLQPPCHCPLPCAYDVAVENSNECLVPDPLTRPLPPYPCVDPCVHLGVPPQVRGTAAEGH